VRSNGVGGALCNPNFGKRLVKNWTTAAGFHADRRAIRAKCFAPPRSTLTPFSTLKTPHSLNLWQKIFRSVTSGKLSVTNGHEQ
jgi:hypothetical protein